MKIKMSLLLLCALFSTQTFAQALPSAPYVVVRGHAERNMKPDRFEISIAVQKTSLDVGEASAVVESKTGAMVKSLKALGLKPTQITATNISISPEYRYDQTTQKNVFIGNQVNRNISAKFENKQTLQKFLAQVPAGEEVRIGGISSTLSTQKAVESELLDAAVVDAKNQAVTLLDKFGHKVIGLYTVSQEAPSIGFESKAMYRSMDVAAAPPLGETFEEGVMTVNKDVYVVYLISAK